ncbi:hypothetical protein BDD12DRAFT_892817 [Trichophaea hybrida]|nr:hypothetical protein BDD12DRAFT_892817 [Trichophaea hybrida]
MSSSGPSQSGFPPKQVDRQAFLKKLQKAKDNMEIANTMSTEQQVDSQTTTDYNVPTTPTQETNYGSFPDGAITTNTEEMDHEATEPAIQEDDTMTEAGDNTTEQDQQGTADSSPLLSLESTPRQLPRRPMNMFNQPGSSIIARRYHQEVGIPQTLNILPPSLLHGEGGSDDQSKSDNSDEELVSPTAQAAQQKKEGVYKKPTNRLLYIPQRKKSAGHMVEVARSVDSQQKMMEAVGESKAVIADVQAKVDHILSQEWPDYAKNGKQYCDNVCDVRVNSRPDEGATNQQQVDGLDGEKLFRMYESWYAEAEERREEEENKQRMGSVTVVSSEDWRNSDDRWRVYKEYGMQRKNQVLLEGNQVLLVAL